MSEVRNVKNGILEIGGISVPDLPKHAEHRCLYMMRMNWTNRCRDIKPIFSQISLKQK